MTYVLHHVGMSCTDPIALERWYTKHFHRMWLKDAIVWSGIWVRCGVMMAARAVR